MAEKKFYKRKRFVSRKGKVTPPEPTNPFWKMKPEEKAQASKCDSYDLNDQCKATIYLCDMKTQTLPPADIWVTMFLDPYLNVLRDKTSRLLYAAGSGLLIHELHKLSASVNTPLSIGQVLQTSPGNLPCKQVFHIIFSDKNTSLYTFELNGAFTKCMNWAQNLKAKSIGFSLFTGQQLSEYSSVIKTVVEASVTYLFNQDMINEVFFVSNQSSMVTFTSSMLHSFLTTKEKSAAKKLKQIGSFVMVNGPHLQVLNGDIIDATGDAMIISTNSELVPGGLCATIYRTAGGKLRNEYNNLSSKDLHLGSAFNITSGDLKCNHVIIAILPNKPTESYEKLLQRALLNSLGCAEKLKCELVFFPAIGSKTMIAFYRLTALAYCQILINALVDYFRENPYSSIKKINIVEKSNSYSKAFQKSFKIHRDFVAVKETPVEILARGPEALRAYIAASHDGTKPVYRTRLMLVGQERVGKTSLMKSLSGQRFDAKESITDGVDISVLCEVTKASVQPWEILNSAKTDPVGHVNSRYVKTVCSLMAEKLTAPSDDKESTKSQDEQMKELKILGDQSAADADVIDILELDSTPPSGASSKSTETHGREHETEPAVIVPDDIQDELLQQLKDEQGEFAKDRAVNLEFHMWDFAGQDVYYTTHQVFLSSRAVYLLVFDLRIDLHQPVKVQVVHDDKLSRYHDFTGLEFLDFWMQSIYAYATTNQQSHEMQQQLSPPIFIVGTHRESSDISPNPDERRELIEKKFQLISDSMADKPYEKHVVSQYYAIENSSTDQTDSELSKLRQRIAMVARQEPYMGKKIPLRWLRFEKSVAEAITNGQHYMNLLQVKKMTRELGIADDKELVTLLHFYHDLGTIIYFGGDDNSRYLQNIVILCPQWLINIFKKIITVLPRDDQNPVQKKKWHRLKKEGILEDSLIDHMWHDLQPQKPALLTLMEKFDLLCPKEDAKTYYVPACLQPSSEENVKQKSAASGKLVTFYIDFKGFLPDGLFHRVLVHAARWAQQQSCVESQLYYRFGSFCLDKKHNFQLTMRATKPMCIKVTINKAIVRSIDKMRDRRDADDQPHPSACSKLRAFLDDTLSKLKSTWFRGIQYAISVACPHQTPLADVPLCLHNLDTCMKETQVRCNEINAWIDTEPFKKWFNADMGDEDTDAKKSTSRSLSEIELRDLAGKVGTCWEKLGTYLGLKLAYLQSVRSDYLMTEDKAFNMLVHWYQGLSKMANAREVVAKALKDCDLVSLAENYDPNL